MPVLTRVRVARRGKFALGGARARIACLTLCLALCVALAACSPFGGSSPSDDAPTPSPAGPAGTPSHATTPSGTSSTGGASSGSVATGGTSTDDPATDPALAAYYQQKATWSGCNGVSGWQCAKVTVPVDWSKPGGETLQLAVTRKKASGTRLGSLFLNPGGPGVPGVSFIQAAASSFGASLRASYDFVSWDTRGVGRSTPVKCLPDSALDAFFAEDATPDTPAETQQFVADQKKYIAACQANTGDLLAHVDSISTVRDLDVLRAVVGDDVLTYYGASYGTYLGAWYAQLFPWRVGRLVLDGAVDPSLSAAQYAQGQAMGFARAVQAFVDDCLTKRSCPLRGTRADANSQLAALFKSADAQPLRTDQGRKLTQSLFATGLLNGFYTKRYWPVVTQGLTEALKGNGTTLLLLADDYNERNENGTYGQTLQVTQTIYCLDHADPRTVDEVATAATELDQKYPPFGGFIEWGAVTCTQWPFKAVVPQQKTTADGARPILVVGSTGDPATPYEWAQSLASQLSSGRLLTRKGEGHTGYRAGSACTDSAVQRYLVSGTLPAQGATCS